MTSPVSTAARIIAELRERLKAEHGLEDGEAALEDTLEGASNLPEILARMAREAVQCEAYSEAIGQIQKANAARAARLESKAANLRVQIGWAMAEAGMKRIPADALPDMTVTLRDGKPGLVIPNDDAVPTEFCRIKTEPNKTEVRKWIESSGPQSWAYLGNAKPVLTIKTV